ncbi:MAG: TonB-dependent receptor [Planctomycetia bacterium]|nr:TonB-dependent receptor [Planctomycetia bacterium]
MLGLRFAALFPLAFLLTSNPTYSQDAREYTTPELLEMDLKELANIEVTVASIRPESIPETPAIVSSYSAKDLEKMGLRSLREFLSFVPGVFIQSSNIPMDSIMVRGVSETFNQKILLLIDDVPYWGPSHSQIPLHGIPLEAIDHIEVIRGPGAVIYGTNASAGVIKVVTKDTSSDNLVALRVGSNDHINTGAFYSSTVSDSVDWSIGAEVQDEDGYSGYFENSVEVDFLPAGTQETSGNLKKKVNMKSVIAKLRIDDLNLMAQAFESRESGSLGAPPTNPAKPAIGDSNGYLVHADYTWNLERSTIKAYTDNNIAYTEAWESNFRPGVERRVKFENSGKDNYRWRSGITLNYNIHDDLSFFIGSEYERRSVGDYDLFIDKNLILTQLEKNNISETSAFGQIDYRFNKFRFLLGGRYTDNENAGSEFTPRLATVYSIDRSQSIKLLYSEGFNSPNFLQTDVQLPFIVGNKELKAEKVKTLDLAYTYSDNNNLFVVNAYRLETEEFILRTSATPPSYDNSGEFERHGLEVDLQHRRGKLLGFFNMAYIEEGDTRKSSDTEAFHTPEITGNLAIHYNLSEQHGLGTSLRYIGPRSGIDYYTIWNIDYQYRYHGAEAFITVRNVLGDDAFSRDMANFSPEPVPVSDPDRSFLTGIKYYF